MARLLFFGALSDVMGRERALSLPENVRTARALIDHLCDFDSAFAAAYSQSRLRIAVNEIIVPPETPIGDSDEIAFLPPFSGG